MYVHIASLPCFMFCSDDKCQIHRVAITHAIEYAFFALHGRISFMQFINI